MVTTPLVTSLPDELNAQLKDVEAVSIGIHQTVRCYFNDGSINYLKSELAPRGNLQFELGVTDYVSQQLADPEHCAHIVWAADDYRHMMTNCLAGRKSTIDDIESRFEPLIHLLHQIHTLPTDTIVLPTWTVLCLRQDAETLSLPIKNKWQIDKKIDLMQGSTPVYQKAFWGFVHGDLNEGNLLFLEEKNKWQLLDWECTQYTDVRWDLASIVVEYELNEVQSERLFCRYAKTINANVEEFQRDALFWIQFYKLTCLCWALKNDHPIQRYL